MGIATSPRRVVIMGAAGRDFHNFNVVYRDEASALVVAFTAAQIPGIAGRRYPASLAGARHPDGIPILDERDLAAICRREAIDEVVFAYSAVEHVQVMHKASIALAAGADFTLLGPKRTMLQVRAPVIAVSAVRTGVGKSQVARWLSRQLKERGLRIVAIRHPMPYGSLERQVAQRLETLADLDAAQCTVEEREEYEPHLAIGNLVYAGADYARIFAAAEKEADIILWDGGNNDFPFIRPSLHTADQLADLAATINRSDADVVVIGSPSDLARLVEIEKPVARARYEFAEVGGPMLARRLDAFLDGNGTRQPDRRVG
jgi:predicted GTPase